MFKPWLWIEWVRVARSGHLPDPLWLFLSASLVSRSISFMIVGVLFRLFGAPIKRFIDKYLGLVTAGFVVLVIAGFLAVTLLSVGTPMLLTAAFLVWTAYFAGSQVDRPVDADTISARLARSDARCTAAAIGDHVFEIATGHFVHQSRCVAALRGDLQPVVVGIVGVAIGLILARAEALALAALLGACSAKDSAISLMLRMDTPSRSRLCSKRLLRFWPRPTNCHPLY